MITTGVTGGAWRASISAWGAIREPDGEQLDWFIAADDRWHDPAVEPSVRQRRRSGTPVTETRVHVPGGDVVQTVYSCADAGGVTVIEIVNESSLPLAIAFTHRGLLTDRPISNVAVHGIELPAASCVVPIAHRASTRVGLPHVRPPGPGRLPADLPAATQVERGWLALTERASRLVVPGGELGSVLAERVTAERCELALGKLADVGDDPVAALLGLHELVRMGERPVPLLPELVAAAETIAGVDGWDVDLALDAAARTLAIASERRAVADIGRIRRRRHRARPPADPPQGVRLIAWFEALLVTSGELLPGGFPRAWLGHPFEVYGVPVGDSGTTVSFAVRWHGERPAVLWEQTGSPVELAAPACAPGWSTCAAAGEALWPPPPM